MRDIWREFDLAGGGLQNANLKLAVLLRKRNVAYALLLLFPLGMHRGYLHDRRGAWLYRAGAVAGVVALLFGKTLLAGLALAAGAAWAIYDLIRIDDTIARINKRLRMEVYMSQSSGAPHGFKGHYTDENDDERREGTQAASEVGPGTTVNTGRGSTTLSFAEQEKRLRELAASRKKPPASKPKQ